MISSFLSHSLHISSKICGTCSSVETVATASLLVALKMLGTDPFLNSVLFFRLKSVGLKCSAQIIPLFIAYTVSDAPIFSERIDLQ